MDFYELLKGMFKTGIIINYDEDFTGECPVGSSKVGGNPDLPRDFQWYYHKAKSHEEYTDLPLSFLAQINCADVCEYDKEKVLPPKGMLYFFYELETMAWGAWDDKGSARVYYYAGDISGLKRTEFPPDLADEYKLPEMPMSFSTRVELPDFVEFLELNTNISYEDIGYYTMYYGSHDEAMAKILAETGFEKTEEGRVNKLLGYADTIQNGMLMNCETASRGVDIYGESVGFSEKIPDKELKQYRENCVKWRLLFQLDTIITKKYSLYWGDVGRIYYYINSDDLAELNFENCWLILQCS